MSVRVAIIDSGIDAGRIGAPVHAVRDFAEAGAAADASAHGTAVARLVLAAAPTAALLDLRIFGADRRCRVAQVVAAIEWAVAAGADLINLSFGQRQPNAALRPACEDAAGAGVLLVASAAARGGPVFPAAYAECIAVAGDARCASGELSWLGTAGIDFGANPTTDAAGGGGASFAAARVCGRLAALLAAGVDRDSLVESLRAECRYRAPERRVAA
jgi:hypothetical protein